ncbi:HD domain-containing protein [Isosphaeraceae bacterium EP7]
MADTESSLAKMLLGELSTLEPGQEAVCYAALAEKTRAFTKMQSPYWKCVFSDRYAKRDFMLWSDDPLHERAATWADGLVYRLHVASRSSPRGTTVRVLSIREVSIEDAEEGYRVSDVYEASRFEPEESIQAIYKIVGECIDDKYLRELVLRIFQQHDAAIREMPAAKSMHHAFTGGLLEHIRSMARVCASLAKHYGRYYHDLDPPLNCSLIVAAGILHDVGKLYELEYHPVAARYTTLGQLIGHVVMGRDMVRAAAAEIEGFPVETLLQLEHAILAHHGKREFGAPVLPATLEALIVSYADDLDAKINQAAQARLRSNSTAEFTEDIFFGAERRRIYKGVRSEQERDTGPCDPDS